uniref:Protein kinase domain-containing protein n=1 Tax=Globodera pallida TaxID=36090 RepID=A0A183CAG8_GLOPA
MDRKKKPPSDRGLVGLDQLIVVDFGLSEPFRDQNGVHREQKGVQFKGSTQWASINAHAKLTKSREDNLESWFYVLVALHKGSLPWHFCSSQSRANVKELKMARRTGGLNEAGRNDALNNLLCGFPEDFVRILKYIDRLTFRAEPNYDWIEGILREVLREYNLPGLSFDWEVNRTQEAWQQPQFNSDLLFIYDGP